MRILIHAVFYISLEELKIVSDIIKLLREIFDCSVRVTRVPDSPTLNSRYAKIAATIRVLDAMN